MEKVTATRRRLQLNCVKSGFSVLFFVFFRRYPVYTFEEIAKMAVTAESDLYCDFGGSQL